MRLFSITWLLALFLTSFSFVAQAQPDMAKGAPQLTEEQKQLMNQIQQSQTKLAAAEKEIKELEQKVISGSPELQKQQQELKDKITAMMNKDGYDAEAEQKALQDIMIKYQKNGEKPSKEVIEDFQQRQQKLQSRRQEVMNSQEVRNAFQSFNDAMLKDAIKINPNTESLIEGMKKEFANMMQLRKQLQQSMAAK